MHSRHKSSFRGMTCAILRPSGPCFHDWRGIPMPWQGPWHCWYSELRWQNLHWWTWNGIPFAQTGPCFQVWWWWWWGGCGRFGKSWLIIGLFFFFWGGGLQFVWPQKCANCVTQYCWPSAQQSWMPFLSQSEITKCSTMFYPWLQSLKVLKAWRNWK